ncbi:MAG TPA: metal ABC transporter permease [Candidatus Entotheonella sp.]|jgi:manganese/iron transport system permease protein/iron/zinc/copper transport system permease protein
MELLLEPLQYRFFLHGLAVSVLTGSLCGLLGVYIVLRQMSYIGHGLAHAVFGGAVASFLLHLNFYIGAGIWGVTAVVLIDKLAARREINTDAAIGIITTASFAVGVALMSRMRRFTQDFEAALFGNVLGVSTTDLAVISSVSAVTGLVLIGLYKPLLFSTFDEHVAQVSGVPTRRVRLLFSCILALVILASMQVLGVTLVAAAVVIPAATARMLTQNFARMLGLSTALGGITAALGMYLSYYLDIASGASIVLLAALIFVGVLAWREFSAGAVALRRKV